MRVFRRDEFVRSVIGQSVPGAQGFVCSQPASATSFPPGPLALVFSDPAAVVPVIQPIITDGLGHCAFSVVAGTYTVVVANHDIIQQVFPDQLIGANGVGSVSFETNGILNTDQATLNLKDGTNTTITPDGIGGVVIDSTGGASISLKTNGTPNADQAVLNLHSSDSSIALSSDGVGGVDLIASGGSGPRART